MLQFGHRCCFLFFLRYHDDAWKNPQSVCTRWSVSVRRSHPCGTVAPAFPTDGSKLQAVTALWASLFVVRHSCRLRMRVAGESCRFAGVSVSVCTYSRAAWSGGHLAPRLANGRLGGPDFDGAFLPLVWSRCRGTPVVDDPHPDQMPGRNPIMPRLKRFLSPL